VKGRVKEAVARRSLYRPEPTRTARGSGV
jgi:hypothetical protein